MRFSLELIAERLRSRKLAARVIGQGNATVSGIRIVEADDEGPFAADLLHVCVERDMPPAPAASALPCMPAEAPTSPCLVVEGASGVAALANAITDVLDELRSALENIAALAWDEDGVSEIIDALSTLVKNPAYAVDSSFKVIGIANDPDMEEMSVNWMHAARYGYLSYDLIANLIRSNELHDIESTTRTTVVHSKYFHTPFANYNLRQDGKVQGHLFVVEMYRKITSGDLELIDLAAPSIMNALKSNQAFQTQRGALYEHFVIDWLEGAHRDSTYIRRQLDALSFDAAKYALVAIITPSVEGDFRRERLARLLEDRQGCRAVHHGNQVIALFQLKRREDRIGVQHKVTDICRKQQCRAALSDVQDSVMDSPRGYRQALDAMRIGAAMEISDDLVRYGDVAAYQPYLNFASVEEINRFLHPAVLELRRYDSTHAVKLLPTLSAFLKNDRDTQSTADELHVHRNTLAYRMNKITAMCPFDLDDFITRHRVLESILIVENYVAVTANLE